MSFSLPEAEDGYEFKKFGVIETEESPLLSYSIDTILAHCVRRPDLLRVLSFCPNRWSSVCLVYWSGSRTDNPMEFAQMLTTKMPKGTLFNGVKVMIKQKESLVRTYYALVSFSPGIHWIQRKGIFTLHHEDGQPDAGNVCVLEPQISLRERVGWWKNSFEEFCYSEAKSEDDLFGTPFGNWF
jgi:hypothetical protein